MSSDTDTSLDVRDLMKRAYVAAPCPVKWEDMKGDEKRRLCAQCDCYVLKATQMTDEEVTEAITRAASGQRVCMQFYKRADGTILTKNCPVGVAAMRARAGRFVRWAAGAVAAVPVPGAGLALATSSTPAPSAEAATSPTDPRKNLGIQSTLDCIRPALE